MVRSDSLRTELKNTDLGVVVDCYIYLLESHDVMSACSFIIHRNLYT